MATSYTDKLRLSKPATGELSGTWGTEVNTGITTSIEDAIAGRVTVTHDDTANYTLTANNGSSDEARNAVIRITGTLTAARNVVCPTQPKLYIMENATTGGYAVTLKTSGGTGVSVANGAAAMLRCDGTNVIEWIPVTGTGSLVKATSPTLVTPALGTPASGVMTNVTGTATGLTAGVANGLKSATTTVAVSAATAPTTGQVLTATSGTAATWQTPGAAAGLRNVIINGNMTTDQRNEGAAQTFTSGANHVFCVDHWFAYCTGANVTGQRVAGAGATQYRYMFTGASSVTGVYFGQRIERANSYWLNNTTVTLAADLAISATLTTVSWVAYYANTADIFGSVGTPTKTTIATGNFTVNSTVTRYSTQISVPSAAITGIEIQFYVGALTAGLTWTIGNVQLEAGSTANDFENTLSYAQQLALCQRYYEKSFVTGIAPASNLGGLASGAYRSPAIKAGSTAQHLPACTYKVTKRSDSGVITTYNTGSSGSLPRDASLSANCTSITTAGVGHSNGFFVILEANAGTLVGYALEFGWAIDAEL